MTFPTKWILSAETPSRLRFASLGSLSERQTGHAQIRRLLLNASRVGDHKVGVLLEREKLEVPDRVKKADAWPHLGRSEVLARSRVEREDHGNLPADLVEGVHSIDGVKSNSDS